MISQQQPAAATEELQINVEKVISDERTLYLLYGLKANEGAVLDQKGQFADFELYFPQQDDVRRLYVVFSGREGRRAGE